MVGVILGGVSLGLIGILVTAGMVGGGPQVAIALVRGIKKGAEEIRGA